MAISFCIAASSSASPTGMILTGGQHSGRRGGGAGWGGEQRETLTVHCTAAACHLVSARPTPTHLPRCRPTPGCVPCALHRTSRGLAHRTTGGREVKMVRWQGGAVQAGGADHAHAAIHTISPALLDKQPRARGQALPCMRSFHQLLLALPCSCRTKGVDELEDLEGVSIVLDSICKGGRGARGRACPEVAAAAAGREGGRRRRRRSARPPRPSSSLLAAPCADSTHLHRQQLASTPAGAAQRRPDRPYLSQRRFQPARRACEQIAHSRERCLAAGAIRA